MSVPYREELVMCDLPAPCQCTLEQRDKLRSKHIARYDALMGLASRLSRSGQITDDEFMMLTQEADEVWDDAVHIASPDAPLRSLCGSLGRNLADLPERPDAMSGCWTCLTLADALSPKAAKELVTA